MKVAELFTGLKYMLTVEQKEIIDALKEHKLINRTDLEDRQRHLAEQMTSMGLIDRIYNEENETVAYKLFTR